MIEKSCCLAPYKVGLCQVDEAEWFMNGIVDLERYPLDRPGSAAWQDLVDDCRAKLAGDGVVNLAGFLSEEVCAAAVGELAPLLASAAFRHAREHNIYFQDTVAGLGDDHPALARFHTVNHTVCADQMPDARVVRLYEWPAFAQFLSAIMDRPALYTMADPLARVNVMGYGAGEALNWHFDRSEFTTTLLLQGPVAGGQFEYVRDLRRDGQPNYDGVARLLCGELAPTVMPLEAGTLNVFRGKNTAHRVTPIEGARQRIIAVFSFFDRPGVSFSAAERHGFYGRAE